MRNQPAKKYSHDRRFGRRAAKSVRCSTSTFNRNGVVHLCQKRRYQEVCCDTFGRVRQAKRGIRDQITIGSRWGNPGPHTGGIPMIGQS